MGTVLASTLITRARGILQDSDSTLYTWSDADLLSYINDGQVDVVMLKPNAYIVSGAVLMASGTKQTLTDGIGIVKITRNMGTDGLTAGNVIHFVPFEYFNYQEKSWHTATASATTELYSFDEKDPTHFYIYPQGTGTGYVELIRVGIPTTLTATTDAIALGDIYQSALLNYVLYRAYSREVDPLAAQLAAKYYDMYVKSLGLKVEAEKNITPKE